MSSDVQDKIDRFFSQYPRREYPKGQILVFADESPDHIFYIVKGRVRKYDVSYRGDEVIINVFQPPAFFPMSWAINRTPNRYFYKAETAVALHVVPADAALGFLQDNPDVAFDLLSRLYRGLEGMYGRLVHLMSGTAKSRLLHELLIESKRFGKQQPDNSYELSVTELDLAARSGLSRETVSREMKKLKASGWVTVAKDGIVVRDIASMEAALGSGI
ncbi:MAG TPA: Crp/Fnr family transcriptional regulator [Candidatus Saccharimonadales bacterium]|nr:Crp/Fnr family transcriptional regulator [Candidatus Saccharimonadales bacterium]